MPYRTLAEEDKVILCSSSSLLGSGRNSQESLERLVFRHIREDANREFKDSGYHSIHECSSDSGSPPTSCQIYSQATTSSPTLTTRMDDNGRRGSQIALDGENDEVEDFDHENSHHIRQVQELLDEAVDEEVSPSMSSFLNVRGIASSLILLYFCYISSINDQHRG